MSLHVGDTVRVIAESFPYSFGRTGKVVRDKNSGLYEIEVGSRTCLFYANEVKVISHACIECGTDIENLGYCSSCALRKKTA